MTLSAVQQLEDIAREISSKSDLNCTINFVFTPNSIGPYGAEESQWQATFVKEKSGIIDYGSTLEEAAKRLLDRLLNPESYPEPNDD